MKNIIHEEEIKIEELKEFYNFCFEMNLFFDPTMEYSELEKMFYEWKKVKDGAV